MANWINRVASYWRQDNQLGPDEVKKSQAHSLISLHTTGNPVWTPRNYAAFAKQGFAENAIGYRCVKMIAEAAASVNLHVVEGGEVLATHPLQELLQNPNPAESGRSLLESFYSFLQISGNAYLEAAMLGDEVRELHVLRPDRMKVIPGQSGWPEVYEYSVNGSFVRFDQSKESVAPILHVKIDRKSVV